MPDETLNESEPALTRGVAAGLVSGVLLLVIARVARAVPELLNETELEQLKSLVALGAPVVAAVLIRRKTTPTAKVEGLVEVGRAEGAAAGVEEGRAAVVAELDALAPQEPPSRPLRAPGR